MQRPLSGRAAGGILRVLHLVKSLGRGGAETLLVDGHRIASNTERFYGYFVPWKDALVRSLLEQGAEVRCFSAGGPLGMMARIPDVADYARAVRADLIHAHLPWAGIIARLVGRRVNIPVIYTEHSLMERYHVATRAANLATWHLQACAIAVSNEVRASAERHAGSVVRIEVVKNGVSPSHFQRDAHAGASVRRELSIPKDAPVVGTVAVFRAQKRLHHWLEAAALFLETAPDARFILVGDGPLREDVERVLREHGLMERAHLVGLQEEVRPYLSAMNVFMMSSAVEGLPVAMLEAMATELPVVATSVGGIPEVVVEGESGYLVPPEDPRALAVALAKLFSGAPEAMGKAARATVAERFSMTRMQAHLEDLYARTRSEWEARVRR